MEKKAKGPFDAAINCLSVMADRDFANGAPHRGQFRAAIRVLEEAGKIRGDDVVWMASAVDAKNTNDREIIGLESPQLDEAWQRVRTLLAALPDGGAE
jgi:hypothetical protein